MAGYAKPTLAELFEEAEFISQLSLVSRIEDKIIFDDSHGIVGFAINFTIFYSLNPELAKDKLGAKYFYLWTPQPIISDPPGPDSGFIYSLNSSTGNDYIFFIRGKEEFPTLVIVDSRRRFLEMGYPQLNEEEPLKWLREAYVPITYGYGGLPAMTANEWAETDSWIRTVQTFESRYEENAKIRKRLYGTSDIVAIRDAFAEVFASYPELPSETILEEKGEDFSIAATRIHEALVEAFGKNGLRRLESGVLVPVEDGAGEEESE